MTAPPVIKSTKSGSAWKRRHKVDRRWLTRRKPLARVYAPEDIKWLWAAYRNGEAAFEPQVFPPEMEKEDFAALVEGIDDQFELFILEAPVEGKGRIPVGLVTIEAEKERLFPHLSWFWWSSPRNRYEALFKFFLKYDEEANFMVHVPQASEAERICDHLTELAILKRIGVSWNWVEDGITVLYEGKASWVG